MHKDTPFAELTTNPHGWLTVNDVVDPFKYWGKVYAPQNRVAIEVLFKLSTCRYLVEKTREYRLTCIPQITKTIRRFAGQGLMWKHVDSQNWVSKKPVRDSCRRSYVYKALAALPRLWLSESDK